MKALIFDMDGLMIDSEKLYFATEREIAGEYGVKVSDEFLQGLMGCSPYEAAQIIIEELKLPITVDEFYQKKNLIIENKYKTELEPMKGLFEILDEFKGKMKLAVATGSIKRFLDIVIDALNIRDIFDVLQPSDEIEKGKPDPEIFLETIEKLGVKPEECVILEDSRNGALAGKKAGCYIIVIPTALTNGVNFDFVDYIASDLIDARNHIKDLIKKKVRC